STVSLAGKGIGVGAFGERIDAPEMHVDETYSTRQIAAEKACKLGDREIDECCRAAFLELRCEPAAEIALDLRPAERAEVISAGCAAVGAAEKPAFGLEFLGIVQRQKQFVGKPERQAAGGFRLGGQGWSEQQFFLGQQTARKSDDRGVRHDCAL